MNIYISREQEYCEQCSDGNKLYWYTRHSKWCYGCKTEWELEPLSGVEQLEIDFNEALSTGTQLDVLQGASRLVADEFAYSPEAGEIENPEFEAHLHEMEKKFDEWWSKNPNSPRVKFGVSEQCKNFLVAIRTKYQPVALVKKVTQNMNSRERSLVWATWKGFAHAVYYPKG